MSSRRSDAADVLWGPTTYPALVRDALERYRTRIAFVHGNQNWTCGETSDAIARLERALSRIRFGRDEAIAVLCGNRPEGWMVEQATMAIGARCVPLRPQGGVDDHAFICEDAEASALVFEAGVFDARAAELGRRLPGLRLYGIGRGGVAPDLLEMAQLEASGRIEVCCRPADTAAVVYTGGTTGRPKGVVLAHRSIVHNFWLTLSGHQWPDGPRFLAATPISHAAFLMIAPVLALGGRVVLHDSFDPDRFLADVGVQGVTATFVVPSMLYALLDDPAFEPTRLASLRTVLYGAAPMAPARMLEALAALGQVFVQTYAQTEAPNTAVALCKEDHDPARPHLLAACGKPLVGVDVEIHNPDEGACPPDEVGEIVIRGPIVMDGYWKRPEETAAALRNGWLHTGDLARRDEEGYLYIVDRLKDMVVTGGVNVYPREVEDVLTTHPGVVAAAVIGVPDERLGESVKALVVSRPGVGVTEDELVALVTEKKGAVQAPGSVDFVDAIPLTPLGKPDRRRLRSRFWQGRERAVH